MDFLDFFGELVFYEKVAECFVAKVNNFAAIDVVQIVVRTGSHHQAVRVMTRNRRKNIKAMGCRDNNSAVQDGTCAEMLVKQASLIRSF